MNKMHVKGVKLVRFNCVDVECVSVCGVQMSFE